MSILLVFVFVINRLIASENASIEYIKCANEIIGTFKESMKKTYSLSCDGSGNGMPHDVESISVSFIAYQKVTVEEARELEVKITEEFINAINSHKKIRPYLREYPFPPERASVLIAFHEKNHSYYGGKNISFVCQVNNKITYYTKDEKTGLLKVITEEPYEEALKIVQSKNPKIGFHYNAEI